MFDKGDCVLFDEGDAVWFDEGDRALIGEHRLDLFDGRDRVLARTQTTQSDAGGQDCQVCFLQQLWPFLPISAALNTQSKPPHQPPPQPPPAPPPQ